MYAALGMASLMSTSVFGDNPEQSRTETRVEVVGAAGAWSLKRNGETYFINGAGGTRRLDLLTSLGGNSVRTWSPAMAEPILDEAQRLGVTVCVGLSLRAVRFGMDYSDPKALDEQINKVVQEVERLKGHPAVLMWGLGNELELEAKGDMTALWKGVNRTAQAVRRADPNRPTAVIVANIGRDKAKQIAELCPDVQILGINAYGDLASIPERLKQQGWTKPYVITEFGPTGHWEVPKTAWGAPIEPTSTEKAKTYAHGYEQAVTGQPGWCLGAYAFLWGQKQERTPTWYGLLLKSGERTAASDVLSKAWTGSEPEFLAPEIEPVKVEPGTLLKPGARVRAHVHARSRDAGQLAYQWVLMHESTERTVGGDPEKVPDEVSIPGLTVDSASVEFDAPPPGNYRLFVYVREGRGVAATANVPMRVE